MKSRKSIWLRALGAVLVFTLLCGVVYPWLMTGIAQLFFKDKANGSIIEVNGVIYGSELLGQQFTGDEYLWGRIMNVNDTTFTNADGEATVYAGSSNKSPASKEYEEIVAERIARIRESNPDAVTEEIPVELITGSGSGLDPHVSVEAAMYQIPRIAKERGMSAEEVEKIIDVCTTGKFLRIFGKDVVNVLAVNLALDGVLK